MCEPNGFCSFPDARCESRRRYDSLADSDVADVCVPLPRADDGSSAGDDVTVIGTSGSTENANEESFPPLEGSMGDGSAGATTTGSESAGTTTPSTEDPSTTTEDAVTSTSTSAATNPSTSETTSSTGNPPLSLLPAVDASTCLTNNLGDNVVDNYWLAPTVPPGTNLFEQAGQLVFVLDPNPGFVALQKAQPGSQTIARVIVDVVQVPPVAANNTQVLFGIGDGTDRLLFEISAGTIAARSDARNGGGGVTIQRFGDQPYDPIVHRHLQIMMVDGEVWWATSSDGVTFETFVEPISQPGYLSEADNRAELSAGTVAFQVAPGPGEFRIQRFEDCDVVTLR